MLILPSWKKMIFLIVLLKVEPSLSTRPLTLMTTEGLFDLETLFAVDAMQLWLQASYFCHLTRPSLAMRCIHLSQRCILSRQMTDNIFEIETTALAMSRVLRNNQVFFLTDFAAAYPSVNHSWIFSVIENTGLPAFLCRFLRNISRDSITHVECAGAEQGQFLMARGVRQGCPASGFLFAMAFDPIFRLLWEAIIPRNPDNLDFLQPAQCAYADDLAVASSSFRGLMTALAPAFRSVDSIAGLNLKYRKRCWVHHGTEEHDSLRTWISEKCDEFSEMQIVRHARHVGTMIGPDGHLHRWTAPRKNIQRVLNDN